MSDRLRFDLLVSDVDGTLVDDGKRLLPETIAAVARLRAAGIGFTLASSRPPRGLAMLIDPLQPTAPVAACNGAIYADRSLAVLESHYLDAGIARRVIDLLDGHGVTIWLFTSASWLVRDRSGPRVEHEAGTVGFEPEVVAAFPDAAFGGIGKLVAAGDDFDLIARCEAEIRARFGGTVAASRSQPYYLDVTDPVANKGAVVATLVRRLGIAKERVAAIGDGGNDIAMFAAAGFGIAMGNAAPAVKARADAVTGSNASGDGFAAAVSRHVLSGKP